jgi:hypothetical protein
MAAKVLPKINMQASELIEEVWVLQLWLKIKHILMPSSTYRNVSRPESPTGKIKKR